jgi:hypothetical protein
VDKNTDEMIVAKTITNLTVVSIVMAVVMMVPLLIVIAA